MLDPIAKSLPCHQIWDEMLPVDGGRICTGCGKLVVDFRNHKWWEIEQAQRESIIPLCGVYDPKQIESWGSEITQPISGCTRMVRLSAALLAFAQIAPGNLPAQTSCLQHQVPACDQKTKQNSPSRPKTNIPPAKKIISGTVVTQINETTKMPLACAQLTIIRGTKNISTETDSFGRYLLDLSNIYPSLHDTFEIIITHPQYFTQTIVYSKNDLKNISNECLDISLSDISIKAMKYTRKMRAEYFGIDPNYKPPVQAKKNETSPTKKESKFKKWWRHLWKKDKK